MQNALLHDAQMLKPTNICCHSYRFAANPAGQITEQLDRLYPGAVATLAVQQNSVCEWMAESVLAQEENSPMVTRPNQPIYPACVPPKSHPPTSRALFVPVSGASPKTDGPASATVSKGSLVHRTEPPTFANINPQQARAASLAMGLSKGGAAALNSRTKRRAKMRQSCGRDRSPSDRMKRDRHPTCHPDHPA
jgi:hypothetical protein